jgi:uncharacterized protein YjdB
MRTHAIRSLAALALVANAGCSGTPGVQPSSPVAAVRVTPEAVALVVGETLPLQAALLGADGEPLGHRALEWTSDDATIAMVDADGNVVARGEGIAHVRATADGQTGVATIRVYGSRELPPAAASRRGR